MDLSYTLVAWGSFHFNLKNFIIFHRAGLLTINYLRFFVCFVLIGNVLLLPSLLKGSFTSWFHSIGNAHQKNCFGSSGHGWYLQAMLATHTSDAMVQVPEMRDPCSNTLYHILQCLSVHWFSISSHELPSSSLCFTSLNLIFQLHGNNNIYFMRTCED